jgi:hypothetical protein
VTEGTYNYTGASYTPGGWLEGFYDPINSGTSSSWIAFQAIGTVELRGNTGGRANMVGGDSAKEYYKFIGFTVNEANIGRRTALFVTSSSHVRFENNTIIGAYRDNASPDNHVGIMVHGPRSTDCTGTIGDIHIKNNSITGITGNNGRNDAAITLYCADDLLIENNEIYSNGNGIYSKSSYTPSALTPAVTIRYNIFRDNTGSGIATQSWSNWHVYQNLLLRNSTAMTMFNFEYYVGGAQPRYYRVVNNTLYGNGTAFRLEGFCEDAVDMVFRNNIVYATTGNTLWGESANCSTGMTKSNYDFDYNLYGQGSDFGDLYYNNFSFATWQGATYNNQDANATSGIDPLFVNSASGDFRLQASSPAINAGIDILDLDNDDSTTDPIILGAYITGNELIGSLLPSAPQNLVGTVLPSN